MLDSAVGGLLTLAVDPSLAGTLSGEQAVAPSRNVRPQYAERWCFNLSLSISATGSVRHDANCPKMPDEAASSSLWGSCLTLPARLCIVLPVVMSALFDVKKSDSWG